MAGAGSTGRGAVREGRPFLLGAGMRGALLASALAVCAHALASERATIAASPVGAVGVRLLDCVDGSPLGGAELPSPLSAPLVVDAARGRAYAASADGTLTVHALPDLDVLARRRLGFTATALAVGPGSDGFLMAGGRGESALAALSPETLEPIHRYTMPGGRSVSALLAVPERRRFVVAFEDVPEAWEIAWNRDAPPVLLGYVHDYRNDEAVPLPGRITPRPFKLASPTRALVAGPDPWEPMRIDAAGRAGVLNLDVRREIERLPEALSIDAARTAPWRAGTPRGWMVAAEGADTLEVVESGRWSPRRIARLPGEALALTSEGGSPGATVLAAHRDGDGIAVTRIAVAREVGETLWRGPAPASWPVRFAAGSRGCVALLDAEGRWLAGFPTPVSPPAR